MESALAWIGQLAEWIGRFFPRREILDMTHSAVKYKRGHTAIACGPGIHWWWPLMSTFEKYPTARQAEDLRSQTVVTTDNKVVVIGGMIVYRVDDILKLLTTTFDPSRAIKDIALTSIHDVCCKMSWDELKAEQRKGTLDTKLKNAAKADLKEYGVEVMKVMLTDLAPTRVLRVVQSISKDE